MWLNLMSTNSMGNPLWHSTCFLSDPAGYSLWESQPGQGVFSPICGCYTEITNSPFTKDSEWFTIRES